jgi:hypothetical protein
VVARSPHYLNVGQSDMTDVPLISAGCGKPIILRAAHAWIWLTSAMAVELQYLPNEEGVCIRTR